MGNAVALVEVAAVRTLEVVSGIEVGISSKRFPWRTNDD